MLDGNPTDLAEQMPDYSGFAICILEDKANQLEIIKRDSGRQVKDILNRVFIEWLNGRGKEPVSWKTLIQCLQSSGHKELVRNMKAVLSMCYNNIYLDVYNITYNITLLLLQRKITQERTKQMPPKAAKNYEFYQHIVVLVVRVATWQSILTTTEPDWLSRFQQLVNSDWPEALWVNLFTGLT